VKCVSWNNKEENDLYYSDFILLEKRLYVYISYHVFQPGDDGLKAGT